MPSLVCYRGGRPRTAASVLAMPFQYLLLMCVVTLILISEGVVGNTTLVLATPLRNLLLCYFTSWCTTLILIFEGRVRKADSVLATQFWYTIVTCVFASFYLIFVFLRVKLRRPLWC